MTMRVIDLIYRLSEFDLEADVRVASEAAGDFQPRVACYDGVLYIESGDEIPGSRPVLDYKPYRKDQP